MPQQQRHMQGSIAPSNFTPFYSLFGFVAEHTHKTEILSSALEKQAQDFETITATASFDHPT